MKKRNKFPTISIVIAAYNSGRTIERCLKSICEQTYPKKNIEILVADGGSTDATRAMAKAYGATVIPIDPQKQNAEYNKSIGIQQATHEIIAMIDHDNILPHSSWLAAMVQPFIDDSEVVGVETLRYHYDPQTSLLDRYFALFGAGDPLAWYLGRADRLSYMFDTYNLAGEAKDMGMYYRVTFSKENLPTVGANGFFVRRNILMKYAQVDPGKYFDMDVNVDLIQEGFTQYAFVKDSILHLTGYDNVWNYLRRRMLFMRQYHVGETGFAIKRLRRYEVFSRNHIGRLIIAILVCTTVAIPLYHSIRGWLKIRDNAWFLHPVLCVSFVVLYSWVIIKHYIVYYGKKFLG